jgi:hypothetical protein
MGPAMTARAIRFAIGVAVCAAFAGCANRPRPPLYIWESFPKLQYEALLHGGVPATEQVAVLEAQAERARATGAALPPGFRAHLGMLKLAGGDIDRARELWLAEKSVFPESAPYMDQLLRRLDEPAKKDKPA